MSNIFDLFRKIEKKENNEPVSFIIAGLGNPGDKYKDTRHNAGFIAVDYIADKLGVRIDRAKFQSLVCEVNIGGKRGFIAALAVVFGIDIHHFAKQAEQLLLVCLNILK